MKTALLIIIAALSGCMILPYESAHGSEITREDIIATVEHQRRLANDAIAETKAAKAETAAIQAVANALQKERDALKGERDWWKSDDSKHIAGENYWRRRAQVILYAFALSLGFAFYTQTKRAIVSPVSGWEGMVIPFLAFAIGAAIGYGVGLYALGWVAQFLP